MVVVPGILGASLHEMCTDIKEEHTEKIPKNRNMKFAMVVCNLTSLGMFTFAKASRHCEH